ncbi:nitrophenyl compound nitroreductase subunit ArsF family protein [Massilibacteroides vaginae]|uniref:nitrophenyl compound nitroreductase subunit ArsF family protein n=1 Tax=Massilibacteroides vaginae TaxID=1673718 RepID=UPI000BB30102|nr:nitrophenyl compound nitroreductase subunit ArsF family protein [Massilibacteroides vaginae]
MIKNLIIIASIVLLMPACGNKSKTNQENFNTTEVSENKNESTLVNVYYFHGKQRCKTCIAVGDLAKKTIENSYAGNDNVRFVEINTSEKKYAALVEKYEISWNALIIAKGDQFTDLTEQAFATAINSPGVLENLIKETVNKNI